MEPCFKGTTPCPCLPIVQEGEGVTNHTDRDRQEGWSSKDEQPTLESVCCGALKTHRQCVMMTELMGWCSLFIYTSLISSLWFSFLVVFSTTVCWMDEKGGPGGSTYWGLQLLSGLRYPKWYRKLQKPMLLFVPIWSVLFWTEENLLRVNLR